MSWQESNLGKGAILGRYIRVLDLNDFSRVVFASWTKPGTFCFICPFIFAGFDGNLQGSELIKFLKSHKFSKIKKTFCIQQRGQRQNVKYNRFYVRLKSVGMCNACCKHSHKKVKLMFNSSGWSVPSLKIYFVSWCCWRLMLLLRALFHSTKHDIIQRVANSELKCFALGNLWDRFWIVWNRSHGFPALVRAFQFSNNQFINVILRGTQHMAWL